MKTPEGAFTFADYPQGFGYVTAIRRNGKLLGMVLRNAYDRELAHVRYFAKDRTELDSESEEARLMKEVLTTMKETCP